LQCRVVVWRVGSLVQVLQADEIEVVGEGNLAKIVWRVVEAARSNPS